MSKSCAGVTHHGPQAAAQSRDISKKFQRQRLGPIRHHPVIPLARSSMFECRTCLRRVWGALLNDLNPRSTSQRSVTHNAARQWQRVEPRRWQSTASVRSPTQDSRRLGPSKSTRMTTHEGRLRQPVKDVRSPGSFKRSLRGDLLDQRGAMVVKNQRTESKEDEVDNTALEQSDSQRDVLTSVEKRKMINAMKFLTDPKKFADHINDLLYKRQNVEAALKFVRFASKSTKCVVAWNHVIRWHLANKKPNAALKLYNEVLICAFSPRVAS